MITCPNWDIKEKILTFILVFRPSAIPWSPPNSLTIRLEDILTSGCPSIAYLLAMSTIDLY